MLIGGKAVIGLILLACSVFAYSFGVVLVQGTNLRWLVFPAFIPFSEIYVVMCMPASVLAIVGLALYVAGKRELKKSLIKQPNLIASRVGTGLGVILLVCTIHPFLMGLAPSGYVAAGRGFFGFIEALIILSPAFLLSVLWTMSGFILLGISSWKDLSQQLNMCTLKFHFILGMCGASWRVRYFWS